MTELLTRTLAPVTSVDTDARRVTVQLCRWLEPRDVSDADGRVYRESYAIDSLDLAPDMSVADVHHGNVVGRIDADSYDPNGEGPTVDLILSRSSAGSDVLADVDAGVIRAVSMEVEPIDAEDRDGVTVRTRSVLHGVAFAFRPAHTAPILATRERPDPTTTNTGETDMETATAPDPATTVVADPDVVTVATLNRSLDELRDDMERIQVAQSPVASVQAELVHRSLGEYAEAVWSDPANPILRRALADQVTTDNPGVVPPGWLSDVAGIVDLGSPLITAFGRSPLPDTGMDVDWPYFDGDMTTLVGTQATQKTPITSVKVSLKKGTAPIVTFAGGSDVAYQLMRRSGPAYMTEYLRIMSIAYAGHAEAVASGVVAATAVDSAATWDPASGDLDALAAALFTAGVEVQTATGVPPTFALAASDVFPVIGAKGVVATSNYGVQNQPGHASVATMSVNVGGIPVIHAPHLAAGELIVSNSQAGSFRGDGPYVATAEDVEKLGQNVAVWGMGAMTVRNANGVRQIQAA